MKQEPESVLTARTYATLAVLPIFWGAVLFLLASVLPEPLLSKIGLDIGLCVGATVPLLIVSGLMLEQAMAARNGDDTPSK